MKDTYATAKLIEPTLIRLAVLSRSHFSKPYVALKQDEWKNIPLTQERISTLGSTIIVDFRLAEPLELGYSYILETGNFGRIPLNVSDAIYFSSFDDDFYYQGNDLGFTYSKSKTTFALWAPLSCAVTLRYRKTLDGEMHYANMIRGPKGVFKVTLDGDCDGFIYDYAVITNEEICISPDPYGKASIGNSKASVVIDMSKLEKDEYKQKLPKLDKITDAVIYELNVRDFTIDGHTNIKHKGKFLGLTEEGAKTEHGNKAGLDYLSSLGITHVQLMPINDYKSTDEFDENDYNWGYDPASYFALEGSYSSNPNDAYARINEAKKAIKALHKHGLRVVMDVVYNHVFEYQSSTLEKIVPGYFFRKNEDFSLSSYSGCGNDIDSSRPMVRKLLVESALFLVKTFGIDGFRFDLMGLLDQETIREIEEKAKKIDPSFVIYGEGWNMAGNASCPMAIMDDSIALPNVSFFNDFYREKMKDFISYGSSEQEVKNAMLGSCLDFIVNKRFASPKQSINYVECHDNNTLYDLLKSRRDDLDEDDILKLVKLANFALLTSCGVPFIHQGQEVGKSKWGDGNTYNKGDKYNKFSYALLDERFEMASFLSKCIAFRKDHPLLRETNPGFIDACLDIKNYDKCLHLILNEEKNVHLFYNPSSRVMTVPFKKKPTLLLETFDEPLRYDGGMLYIAPRIGMAVKEA